MSPQHRTDYLPLQRTIRLSLVVGILMLVGKTYAAVLTGSAAILSDAAESVVHIAAVAFAAFSMWFSVQPADESHPYGHDRISFFSAGVEGGLIVLAALFIIYEAVVRWIAGIPLHEIETGIFFIIAATLINLALGWYILAQGRKRQSLILIANGKHVLTDSWTSAGVVVGLLLVVWSGWKPFDPILAIIVAINILWSGGKLVRRSVGGLMDESDPQLERRLRELLDKETTQRGVRYHGLRHRYTGVVVWVDVHLLFPSQTPIHEAHWKATEIEVAVSAGFAGHVSVNTHLEPVEEHERVHQTLKEADD